MLLAWCCVGGDSLLVPHRAVVLCYLLMLYWLVAHFDLHISVSSASVFGCISVASRCRLRFGGILGFHAVRAFMRFCGWIGWRVAFMPTGNARDVIKSKVKKSKVRHQEVEKSKSRSYQGRASVRSQIGSCLTRKFYIWHINLHRTLHRSFHPRSDGSRCSGCLPSSSPS